MNHDNTRRQQGENLEKCNARAEDARRRQMKPRGDPVQRWAGAGRRSRHPKQARVAGTSAGGERKATWPRPGLRRALAALHIKMSRRIGRE